MPYPSFPAVLAIPLVEFSLPLPLMVRSPSSSYGYSILDSYVEYITNFDIRQHFNVVYWKVFQSFSTWRTARSKNKCEAQRSGFAFEKDERRSEANARRICGGRSEAQSVRTWQREKDSNPHKQSQSLSCYLYTIPLCARVLYGIFEFCQGVRITECEKQKTADENYFIRCLSAVISRGN